MNRNLTALRYKLVIHTWNILILSFYLIIIYQEPYPYNINAVVIYKWLGHDR